MFNLATGAKVVPKSLPTIYVKSLATRQDLYQSTEPSAKYFTLNIHLHPTVCSPVGYNKIPSPILLKGIYLDLHCRHPQRILKSFMDSKELRPSPPDSEKTDRSLNDLGKTDIAQ